MKISDINKIKQDFVEKVTGKLRDEFSSTAITVAHGIKLTKPAKLALRIQGMFNTSVQDKERATTIVMDTLKEEGHDLEIDLAFLGPIAMQ